MDKKEMVKMFIETLTQNVKASNRTMEMQKDFIADSPGPMQSRYDSAMVEGQWLLANMQKNHDELNRALACLQNILEKDEQADGVVKDGSLLVLDSNGKKTGYLLLNAKGGAGTSVTHEGRRYLFITTQSPLGKVLLGKKVGDTVELKTSKVVRYVIDEVL